MALKFLVKVGHSESKVLQLWLKSALNGSMPLIGHGVFIVKNDSATSIGHHKAI